MARARANPHTRHWRGWYKLAIWLAIRRQQLMAEPLCRICKATGRIAAAVEVDHVIPHGGDWNSFIMGEKQSLCAECHWAKSARAHRKNQGHNADGTPVDLNHWWHQSR
jgi:5-methylcytosine-specific restriction enzyme A